MSTCNYDAYARIMNRHTDSDDLAESRDSHAAGMPKKYTAHGHEPQLVHHSHLGGGGMSRIFSRRRDLERLKE
jgi:hypothetical protein